MLKRIISHATLFFIVIILALSQVFVDVNFVPIGIREFLSVRFWQDVVRTVDRQDALFLGCSEEIAEEVSDEVIGPYQGGRILARQSDEGTWSLFQQDTEGNKKLLVEGVLYRNPYDLSRLSRSLEEIERYVIYPSCEKSCELHLYDLETSAITAMSVVTTGSDTHDDSFSDLELLFYDESRSRILFTSREQQKAYVVSYDVARIEDGRIRPYLWHDIALKTNETTTQQIIGVAYDTLSQQHLLLKVVNTVSATQRLVLYNLTTPAVRLQHVPESWDIVADSWLVRAPDQACVPIQNEAGDLQFLNFE